jgi:NADPH-dependent 2,4-dienoyl-CoA reductase/sulfur reductase-like enzyme
VLGYDGLIIATGAAPRRLPGQPDAAGIHMLRTLDDSTRLRAALTADPRPRFVVIGAGFIGLEVAATARTLGCEVVVLEGASAPLIRGLGAEMGTAVAALHADRGVPVRCGVMVLGFAVDETTGAVRGVRVARPEGGEELVAADVVLVGVGVGPVTDWLKGSGLELRDGIVCDATLWTGAHRVFAAGDCARWVNELYDEEMRVEHWTNASEQGAAAARNLLAVGRGQQPVPYAPVPFFWSDQYDSKVQFLGRAASGTAGEAALDIEVLHGSLESRKFVALYGRHGRFRGVLGVSMPRVVMPYRRLLAQGASWDEALAHAASVG